MAHIAIPFPFREARRAHTSVLAPLEKRALVWLARRTPRAINSDHLTALGLLSLLAAGGSYALTAVTPAWLLSANLFLMLNWLGDSLDGTLARERNRLRPRYGFYVDHMVDAIGTLALLGGLAASPVMTPAIAIALLIAYLLLSIEVYLATHTVGTFHLSFAGVSPTELRLLLIAGNTYVFFGPDRVLVSGAGYLLFDVGGVVGIAALAFILARNAIMHAAQLYREERLP